MTWSLGPLTSQVSPPNSLESPSHSDGPKSLDSPNAWMDTMVDSMVDKLVAETEGSSSYTSTFGTWRRTLYSPAAAGTDHIRSDPTKANSQGPCLEKKISFESPQGKVEDQIEI